MSAANNPRETLARTAQQTMSVLVLLSVVSIIFVETSVLDHLIAATCLVIARRVREIVMMIWDVKAPLSVEVTTVLGTDSAAVMIVADVLKVMRVRAAHQTVSVMVLLFVVTMTTNADRNAQALGVAART